MYSISLKAGVVRLKTSYGLLLLIRRSLKTQGIDFSNAVFFDVPMAIQNTARFESVNDYRVPVSHLMFGTSICLIKVTVSFYYLYRQLE